MASELALAIYTLSIKILASSAMFSTCMRTLCTVKFYEWGKQQHLLSLVYKWREEKLATMTSSWCHITTQNVVFSGPVNYYSECMSGDTWDVNKSLESGHISSEPIFFGYSFAYFLLFHDR